MNLPRFFVFDVESVGLYGEDFAVAYVVVDRSGTELDAGLFNCPVGLSVSSGQIAERHFVAKDIQNLWNERAQNDWSWLVEYVLSHMPEASHNSREQMHSDFWNAWTHWRDRGAVMWADWGYPVEANFLRACVFDNPSRIETAPCPLMEIETVRSLSGLDPGLPRCIEHLPAHDPLNDARHSARILIESLNRLDI